MFQFLRSLMAEIIPGKVTEAPRQELRKQPGQAKAPEPKKPAPFGKLSAGRRREDETTTAGKRL